MEENSARNLQDQGAVLLTVGRPYVGNDVTHSMLLDRACACSYKNLPKYRSYGVSNTAPRNPKATNVMRNRSQTNGNFIVHNHFINYNDTKWREMFFFGFFLKILINLHKMLSSVQCVVCTMLNSIKVRIA